MVEPGAIQDANAGNAGDIGKHGVYLCLLRVLREHPAWRPLLRVVEAHAGKGLYLHAHPQWLAFRQAALGRELSIPLIAAQTAVLGPAPVGVGAGAVQPGQTPYAGSALLHAHVLNSSPARSLVCHDADAGVRQELLGALADPCFDAIRNDVVVRNPGEHSEPVILNELQLGNYSRAHVIHLDPFPFVMAAEDQPVRDWYHEIVAACDQHVAAETLGAASVFITWGNNGRAAQDDLFGAGYQGGLPAGYQDLRGLVAAVGASSSAGAGGSISP